MIALVCPPNIRRLAWFGWVLIFTVTSAVAQEQSDPGQSAEDPVELSVESSAETAAAAAVLTNFITAHALALEEMRARQTESLRAIEELRRDALAAAQRNDEAMSARLELIKRDLMDARESDLQEIRDTNRATLWIVTSVAGAALLCLLIALLYLLNIMRRLAEAAAVFPSSHPLFRGAYSSALASGESSALGSGDPARLTAGRLLETIEQIQRNVRDLQEGGHLSPGSNGSAGSEGSTSAGGLHHGSSPPSEKPELISSLMGKGNTLLNMGQADEALTCYNEALSIDANCTGALLKKGKALEKLRRMEEAIESYDRALSIDDNLTIAHLGKGGVLNRMERYAEALDCYEKAMQTQRKTATPA